MASARVVAFEFVVDLRGCTKRFFEAVCANERRGTIHLVEVLYLLRDIKERSVVVKFLFDQLVTKYRPKIIKTHRLVRAGIDKRCRLVLHIRSDVVPLLRDLVLIQIDLVGDFLFFTHFIPSFLVL